MNHEHAKVAASMVILGHTVGKLAGRCDVLIEIVKRLDRAGMNCSVNDVDILGVDATTLTDLAAKLDEIVAALELVSPTVTRIYRALPILH